MYRIEKKNYFYVLDRNNNYREFKDRDSLICWLQHKYALTKSYFRVKDNKIFKMGHNWNDTYTVMEYDPFPQLKNKKYAVEFIVFDSHHRVVQLHDILEELKNLLPNQFFTVNYMSWRHRRIEKNWLGFRNGPVPYTGFGNKCSYRYEYKNPRTTQERKRNSWDRKFARSKRCKRYLPNYWDDIPISKPQKSWKKQKKKKKQWMK